MQYEVAVRALAAFTAKRGNLDLRFTPAPTAEQGQGAHQLIAQRRGQNFQTEVALTGQYAGLRVNGRADGFDHQAGRLEEIKSHRVHVDRIPANHIQLAWVQAKLYAALLCDTHELTEIDVQLTYVHVVSLEETHFVETHSAESLQQYFSAQCEAFLEWAEQEDRHRETRDQWARELAFPFSEFRTGQRILADQVYFACRDRYPLLAQATTGIGKTLGTLFPLVKAMGERQLDRIFYLSAKTPGRRLALDALGILNSESGLRVLEMVSLEKSCEHPDKACHGDSCPLAQGFYDRLAAARQDAADSRHLDQKTVRKIAARHQICPYWLSHEMAQWSDVVIGDYNYYFDSAALLYSLTQIHQWNVGVLVDEAHNLSDRARSMYSVELSESALELAIHTAPPKIKSALKPLAQLWPNLFGSQEVEHQIYPTLPQNLITALQKAITQITNALADAPQRQDGEYMRFYFDALAFVRLAEEFDDDSLFDVTLDDTQPLRVQSTLAIRNLIPAYFLAPRFEAARSCTLFSATLIPPHFHRDVLGLPAQTQCIDVPSPFRAEQLSVHIARDVSTRYRDRLASQPNIVRRIVDQCRHRPGNYIAFFSSYQYLNQVLPSIRQQAPELSLQIQREGMSEIDRQRWLDAFDGSHPVLGLAVLGGAFSEGIDLPGSKLIGAFITTLGMPAKTDFSEALQSRMQTRFGQGFDYTYRYPGLQKVIQAAGRVIRDLDDQGTLYLLDDRYARPENRALLPSWWAC